MTTATTFVDSLHELVLAHSKHSDYQLLHPSLVRVLGDAMPAARGRHEAQRFQVMSRGTPMANARLLDIGANTGYFSFAAVDAGAREVVSQEGNAEHARFIQLAAQAMGLAERLQVKASYQNFRDVPAQPFDITLCLNVLHHLGDDFGDQAQPIEAARDGMIQALNHLARCTRHLWMQLGFNWKGDRHHPLFARGTKAELIEFVQRGVAGQWHIEEVFVVDASTRDYVPLDDANIARVDALGEFLNRPLFRMRSLRLA